MAWLYNSLSVLNGSIILVGASIMLFNIFYAQRLFSRTHIHKYNRRWKMLVGLMLAYLITRIIGNVLYYTTDRIFSFTLGTVVFIIGGISLLVAIRTSFLAITDLQQNLTEIEAALADKHKLETVLENNRIRLLKQNDALLFLTKNLLEKENQKQALQLVTEKAAEILDADRVSIWLFDEEDTYLTCADIFTKQQSFHTKGHKLYKDDYPAYFNALETDEIINAYKVATDPRTKEYAITYLTPLGTASLLSASIRIEGRMKGVLCIEAATQRNWTIEEQSFAAALIDNIAVTIETFRRKKIMEQLALSESTFRNAFEYSGIGMALVSPEGRWMKVNKEICKIVGYTEEELLATTFQKITHPSDLDADLKLADETLKGLRDTYSLEKRYIHKNGTIIWINLTVSIVRDRKGQPLFFISQIEDINDRKLIRRDLERALSLTKTTLESTADGIFAVDPEMRVTNYNQQFLKLWKMPESIVKAGNYSLILEFVKKQVIDPDKFEARAKEIYANPGMESHDIIHFSDGRVVERYSKPQMMGDEIIGRVSSFRDISKQKHAEEQIRKLNTDLEKRVIDRTTEIIKLNNELKSNIQNLETANKDLESFSYSVSHDLRAPLRSITSFSRILEKRSTTMDEDSKKFLSIISSNAKKMDQLIEDLLAFSRAGKKELQKTLIDMNALLREVLETVNIHEWNEHTQVVAGDLLPVLADRNLLKQVLVNLVANAVKYSRPKENPLIEIGSYAAESENTYFVKDNGVGFSMQYYDKLFKVFQRMHSTEEFEGVGVGLAIVHRIITKHGGRVWAEAKLNEGASFYFALPNNVNPSELTPASN